jgi:hypothetical protein
MAVFKRYEILFTLQQLQDKLIPGQELLLTGMSN